jgi:hypothetical protein
MVVAKRKDTWSGNCLPTVIRLSTSPHSRSSLRSITSKNPKKILPSYKTPQNPFVLLPPRAGPFFVVSSSQVPAFRFSARKKFKKSNSSPPFPAALQSVERRVGLLACLRFITALPFPSSSVSFYRAPLATQAASGLLHRHSSDPAVRHRPQTSNLRSIRLDSSSLAISSSHQSIHRSVTSNALPSSTALSRRPS